MRVLAAFIRHELRLQRRSRRFVVLALGFLALGILPSLLVFARWPASPLYLGPATFAAETLAILPLLATVLGFALGVDGIQRERDEGSWPVLSLAPLSNAGYLLRRWLALCALALPLTVAPLAVAAGAAVVRCGSIDLAPFAGPLLLQVWPLALLAAAFGLGVGTIARGMLGGALLAVVSLGLLHLALERLSGRLSLDGLRGFLNLTQARWSLLGAWGYLRGEGVGASRYPVPASEAPLDLWVAGEQYLALGLMALGLGALALALGLLFLGRTQRDLRPWRLPPDHPLRHLGELLNRLRQRYSVDGMLGAADRTFLALGIAAFAATLAFQAGRAAHYLRAAEMALAAAVSSSAGTPTSVVPARYALAGRISAAGEVDSTLALELENRGDGPVGSLILALNPELLLNEVSAEAGAVRATRTGDRLRLDLDPALAAGGRRSLVFRSAGRPVRRVLAVGGWIGADRGTLDGRGFADAFRADDAAGLDRSYVVPAASGTRLAFAAQDLAPVLRYAPAGEHAPPERLNLAGAAWAADPFRPPAQVEIDLEVPRDLLVADACGGLVEAGEATRRLHSRCTMAPSEYAVVGGRYELVSSGEGGPPVAVFPHHAELAELHLGSLAREAALADVLWPSLPGLSTRLIVEWPDPTVHRLGSYLSQVWDPLERGDPRIAQPQGRLLLVSERRLVSRQPLEVAPFLARTVAAELLARRPVAPEQEEVFRRLYEELARLRMGSPPPTGAVVPSMQGGPGPVMVPLLDAAAGNRSYWQLRFPALVFALRSRVGEPAILEAVDRFTAEPGAGTLAGLLAHVEEAAGSALGSFADDFVLSGELPELTLADVTLEPAAAGWRIEGAVVNRRGGEAVCTVEALTAVSSVSAVVTATDERPGRFAVETRYKPQTLLLDPEQLCHRYRALVPVPVERLDFTGT